MDTDPLPYPLGTLLNIPLLLNNAVSAHAPEHWFGWIVDVAIAMICLLISAFVSGSEIAFFGLNQSEIENLHEEESSNTRKTCALLDNSEQLLATILISNNLVNVTMVILLTFAIGQTVTFHSSIVEFVSQTVVLTFLLLLFGEVLPKLTARGRKLVWVKRATPGIWACYKFFSPISRCMVRSTSIVGRIVTKKQENISTEELSQALEISDVKEDKDKEMLEGILTFGEKQASDIMTPRVDVTAIEYHSTWKEVISIVLDSGYSRIPVYDKSQDSIRGVLYSKDLLPYLERDGGSFTWQTLIRKAYFVPESRMLDDLLEDFRKRKIHIAIVVDEYGCTQGMVTLEDILEEIVGDIDDEYDTEDSRLYREIKPGVYRFLAKTPLVDFFRITDLDPESFPHADDVETLAGLILAVKGDFPKEKETIEAAGCHFTVLKMERHRIQSLIVKTHG